MSPLLGLARLNSAASAMRDQPAFYASTCMRSGECQYVHAALMNSMYSHEREQTCVHTQTYDWRVETVEHVERWAERALDRADLFVELLWRHERLRGRDVRAALRRDLIQDAHRAA